jgi:hypothetical protein
MPKNAKLGYSQVVDFGGERGTRTLDPGFFEPVMIKRLVMVFSKVAVYNSPQCDI